MTLAPVFSVHNFIAFYKSEEEWKWNHNLRGKISLETEFSVKMSGKHILQITFPYYSYQIALEFDSVMKRNQWYQALTSTSCMYHDTPEINNTMYNLIEILGYYHVDLARCREFPYIEGEYVIEVCPAFLMVWPVKKDKLGWEWKFSDIKHFRWHVYATKLEVNVERYFLCNSHSCVLYYYMHVCRSSGAGQFFFIGRHAHRLFVTMKNILSLDHQLNQYSDINV